MQKLVKVCVLAGAEATISQVHLPIYNSQPRGIIQYRTG
uniref:Uncharacterized protein n=1 Tax=Anguilla anguilla TaxID=7936 RepID=A0A0E9WJB7_ANGAN